MMALILVVAFGWFLHDRQGLPDTQSLAQFAPMKTVEVKDPCHNFSSIAVPYDRIGYNLRSAIQAAETPEDAPGILRAAYQSLTTSQALNSVSLSMRVARTSFCNPAKPLDRAMDELRISLQLERQFSQQRLFTILANRLYLGGNFVGVESGSQHYFHKEPEKLTIAESAMLAGLAKSPSRFSPASYPDRAVVRRNQVLDSMAQKHLISQSGAETAKATPLGLISN